jgi:predicted PurR-regulated permease PerM
MPVKGHISTADELQSVAHSGLERGGPIVWTLIVLITCVLLFVLQKILWLVVPALLALILYYALHPMMRRFIYAGMNREAAAALAMAGFLAVMTVIGVIMTPWTASRLGSWHDIVLGYVQGGMNLLTVSLHNLEKSWPTLANARLAETVANRFADAAGRMSEHIEPFAVGVMGWTPALLLAPFLAFFFLRDGLRFERFLASTVPNAFFEHSLYLLHSVDQTLRAYFKGLLKLTILDTLTLAAGLAFLGFPGAFALGLLCAVLAWIPFVGSILGGLVVVLVAATDFPNDATMAYWTIALFVLARLLDDFVYMPLTIGKSLHMHPMLTVLMIFIGGSIAGVAGLVLVLPLLGVVMVIGETIGQVVTNDRLVERYRHEKALRRAAASGDLSYPE